MSRRDQRGDAPGDRPGLAGARAGQHTHRTTRGQHRLALLVVELVEVRARGATSLLTCAGPTSLLACAAATDMGYIMAGRTDIAGTVSRVAEVWAFLPGSDTLNAL